MSLQVVAVSAPEYPFGRVSTTSLASRDPVSLYNACRYAAFLAESGIGAWSDSNWQGERFNRQENTLLMSSFREECSYLEELLAREHPNLLLIGAMTQCFPGAIECALMAREMFGDSVCIVLGGRHANETIYTNPERNDVLHHPGSPLALMRDGRIDPIFDFVVSGEAEFIIAKIGEVVATCNDSVGSLEVVSRLFHSDITHIPGDWILGRIDGRIIKTIISRNVLIDKDRLPSPARMFGIRARFPIFGCNALTGHVFSDISPGCVYSCDFCSEALIVSGRLKQIETRAHRLFRQLLDVNDVIKQDAAGLRASAFVEDSIILAGLSSQLKILDVMLENHPIDIVFGGQMTVDFALKRKELLRGLARKGLAYLFVGLETADPASIGGMSKDVGKENWLQRSERMIAEYTEIGIRIGVSVLFGLGESQSQRIALLEKIAQWREAYENNPQVVSFNWATQHPLKGNDDGAGYEYLDWSVEFPEYARLFNAYGEATHRYPIVGVAVPLLEDLEEIQYAREELTI